MKEIRPLSVGCLLLILVGIFIWSSQVGQFHAQAATAPATLEWPVVEPAGPDDPTVIGGQEATPGAWPWMVALVHATNPDSAHGQFCGGSLIAPTWVLTAAHCTYDLNGHPRNPAEIDVVIGRHNLTTTDGTRIHILQIIRHPGFGNQNYDNDVALFQLTEPVAQKPIGLATMANAALEANNRTAVIIGWGITEAGSASDVLRQVEAPLVDVERCRHSYGIFNGRVTDNMICAGLPSGGKDSCHGDSGGPLMVFDEQSDQWKQIGIVSWGEGCAEPNYYGVYTRLSHYADWVTAQIPTLATPTVTPTPTTQEPLTPTPTQTLIPTAPPTVTPTLTLVPTRVPTNQQHMVYLPLVIHNEVIPLRNGSFEEGADQGWDQYSLQGIRLISTGATVGITPQHGEWVAKLAGTKSEVAFVYQKLSITRAAPMLEFWLRIDSSDSCGYDFGGVIVNNTIVDQFDLCESTANSNWQQRKVDLRAFVGMTVTLEIRAETDKLMHSTLWLDDVRMNEIAPSRTNAATAFRLLPDSGMVNSTARRWTALPR